MSTTSTLQAVTSVLLGDRESVSAIDRETVRAWMKSDDLETCGAVSTLLFKADILARIQPALEPAEFQAFLLPYWRRCIYENCDGDWADSPYTAAMSATAWIRHVAEYFGKDSSSFGEIRDWLGDIYRSGDKRIRRCIVDGCLEHVFEDRSLMAAFSHWNSDNTLREAMIEASNWVERR